MSIGTAVKRVIAQQVARVAVVAPSLDAANQFLFATTTLQNGMNSDGEIKDAADLWLEENAKLRHAQDAVPA